MREIPILFSTPMVKAIIAGTKTQTRRLIKGVPDDLPKEVEWGYSNMTPENQISLIARFKPKKGFVQLETEKFFKCPYGTKGDILWVKEMHYHFGRWKKNGFSEKTGKQKWKFKGARTGIAIKYMDNPPELVRRNGYRKLGWYKRNSLFMPKTACRLRLQITNIRVERLQDISFKDCMAEGIDFAAQMPRLAYRLLWEKINGDGSWNKNPWVWVVEFKVMKGTYLTISLYKRETAHIIMSTSGSRKYKNKIIAQ